MTEHPSIWTKLSRFGPGLLVTAAFIGPGTVTTASKAGSGYGYALLWTVVFAVIATVVLQEMAARLGLVTRQGLGDVIRTSIGHPVGRFGIVGLMIVAIFFGNAAYQTGNLTGAAIGFELASGASPLVSIIAISALAGLILFFGGYKVLERLLICLVVVMSLMFLVTAILIKPDVSAVASSMVPSIPQGSLPLLIAMIGTTVVPYNLFLHASAVQQRWDDSTTTDSNLREARLDSGMAIVLGGLVTAAIVVTGARIVGSGSVQSAADMAKQLEPLFGGRAAEIMFSIGLCAAGLTSAVTAPLAAAYATSGAMGWKVELRDWKMRAVWMSVLISGAICAVVFGKSPTQTILIAQIANGLLLPVIAIMLLVAVNNPRIMGQYRNGILANMFGGAVVLFAVAMGSYLIATKLGLMSFID